MLFESSCSPPRNQFLAINAAQASKLNCEIAMPCHNQPHGAKHPATFQRICRGFCHRRHLVAAIAFPILLESLLRSLVAKFLPLRRRLSRHRPVCSISISARTEDRHACRRPLLDSVSAKCCPPNHASRRAVLHGTGRLRHLCTDVGNFYSAARARLFSRGTLPNSPMAVPTRNAAWIAWRVRRDLVSIERRRSTYGLAGSAHRIRGHLLLGALRCAR